MQSENLRLVKWLLTEHDFCNDDIGPLNSALEIDHFIVSLPKCGTTAIQRALQKLDYCSIHCHTDVSTYAAFENGDILQNHAIGMAEILKARLEASTRHLFVYFGYREPVSWYLSLAGEFRMALDASLRQNFSYNIKTNYPWSNYRIDEIARIYRDALSVDLYKCPFDANEGIAVIEMDRVSIVLFRSDKSERLEQFLREKLDDRIRLTQERVNHDPGYTAFCRAFTLERDDLQRAYRERWCQHFFSAEERDGLLASRVESNHLAGT